MVGEDRERLDVEGEARRRPFLPRARHHIGGKEVVGRVHLDKRELRRVVAQTLLRVARPLGVPARAQQRLVGPRGGAYEYLAGRLQLTITLSCGTRVAVNPARSQSRANKRASLKAQPRGSLLKKA